MKICIVFIAGALMLSAVGATAQQRLKIGYVNGARIQNESVLALRFAERMKKEFGPREKQILDLQSQIAAARERLEKEKTALPPSDLQARGREIAVMMQRSDQMALSLAEDLEQRKNEEVAKIIDEARSVINAIAEAGNFDLILQQAVYGSPRIDITDQVIKELAKRAGAASGPGK